MWIIDSRARDAIELWDWDGGTRCRRIPVQHGFYLHFDDPGMHAGMMEAVAEICPVKECTFRTVFGELDGFCIGAGRSVAEAIERQSGHAAQLYNVDIRPDQKYLAEHGLTACGRPGESRFAADFAHDLRQAEIRVCAPPQRDAEIRSVEVTADRTERFSGTEKSALADLAAWVQAYDPEVILFPDADIRTRVMVEKARDYGLDTLFSRSGRYRKLDSRSYWSYGRVEHRQGALIPDGRILIDTEQSFVFREGGLPAVLLASRLTGLPPNLTSRFTPGTLVSGYEVYEAFRQGIAVPFRKAGAECVRTMGDLRAADRGGMLFQPVQGVYAGVSQLDFTSLYPSIIVKANLSPETIGHTEKQGFLSGALAPLLALRVHTKRMKETAPQYEGIDAVLKWMLVTCFGYTGYRNAKFGRIEVHEAITARSREILLQAKRIAESAGLAVLHGIVDCIWVTGGDAGGLAEAIGAGTGMPCTQEDYDWIAFLPLADGLGAYTRYFGRLKDGSVRVRGIAARRHDTPAYVREMQQAMLTCMARTATIRELVGTREAVAAIRRRFLAGLPAARPSDLLIHRRISRLTYAHHCLEGAAVQAYRNEGIDIAPGMKIQYIVQDAGRYSVARDPENAAIDIPYYRALLVKAADEVAFACVQPSGGDFFRGAMTSVTGGDH